MNQFKQFWNRLDKKDAAVGAGLLFIGGYLLKGCVAPKPQPVKFQDIDEEEETSDDTYVIDDSDFEL